MLFNELNISLLQVFLFLKIDIILNLLTLYLLYYCINIIAHKVYGNPAV